MILGHRGNASFRAYSEPDDLPLRHNVGAFGRHVVWPQICRARRALTGDSQLQPTQARPAAGPI